MRNTKAALIGVLIVALLIACIGGALALINWSYNKDDEETKKTEVTTVKEETVETKIQTEITTENETETEAESETIGQIVFRYTNDSVNLRAQPGTDSDIVMTLETGTKVKCVNEENGWTKVESGKKTGYIKTDFLITKKEYNKLQKKN